MEKTKGGENLTVRIWGLNFSGTGWYTCVSTWDCCELIRFVCGDVERESRGEDEVGLDHWVRTQEVSIRGIFWREVYARGVLGRKL
jgi:hypothetical protein